MKRTWDVSKAEVLVENTTLPLFSIANRVGASYAAMRMWYSQTYTEEFRAKRKIPNYRASKLGDKNPMKGKVGSEHPNFKGRSSDGKGYYTVLKPTWWTGKQKGKRVFEHQVVYALANGLTEIPEGMEIHHIDEDGENNSPGNLELLTPTEHKQRHLQNVSKDDD